MKRQKENGQEFLKQLFLLKIVVQEIPEYKILYGPGNKYYGIILTKCNL